MLGGGGPNMLYVAAGMYILRISDGVYVKSMSFRVVK